MSRPLRLEWPGGLYHVTSRGDRREPIVENDGDRVAWVAVLGQTCERFNWRVHAWCLMDNHYHLLLETPEGNLSSGMRHLNGVWSQTFNRRHARVGHVFQGRFKAIIVQREGYLLELARYVVLNPVRARMVADAAEYRWSSYGAMTGQFPPDAAAASPWLETDWLLAQLSTVRQQAIALYIDHVRAGVGLPSVWQQLQGQVFMGSADFVAQIQRRLEAAAPTRASLREVPLLQRRPQHQPLVHYQHMAADRNAAMALAFRGGGYTQAQIAQHFGVSVPTVSRAVRAPAGGQR